MGKQASQAEVTLKSGAVVTFECTSISWSQKRNLLGEITEQSLKWEQPEGAKRRPIRFELDEIAAVVFVDAS